MEDRGHVRLTVHDDGDGIPVAADLDASSGFGIKLMRGLAEQLRGSI
jgi:two-component sensor histidine kinase